MRYPEAALEDWLRDYYFDAAVDISSSGVEPYSLGDLEQRIGLDLTSLSKVSFRDSRSAGADGLRELIADHTGLGDPSRVLAACGSTEAQLLALNAVLEPGDEVVVCVPAYHTLVNTAVASDCRITPWPLRWENRFQPDFDELRRIVGPGTTMIVVNFPHNPTGVTLTREQQRELVEIAAVHGSWLVWDGAFEDLALDADPLPPVSLSYERGISFGSLSKAFGLPGLRVGWGLAPRSVVDAAVSIRDYTTLALSPLVEHIAMEALSQAGKLIGPRLETARIGRDVVADWVRTQGAVDADIPAAGVLVFPELKGVADTVGFCHRLMRRHGVLTVPGDCFGKSGHVRIGFGVDEAELRRGLDVVTLELEAEDRNEVGP